MTEIPADLQTALAGRYTLTSKIGRGGVATIYLADDVRRGHEVAVKVLRPDLAETTGADRFLRESEIAGKRDRTPPYVPRSV